MTTSAPAVSNAAKLRAVAGHLTLAAYKIGLTWSTYAVFAWLISWGLRHGLHFGVGYLGLSILLLGGVALGKNIVSNLGRVYGESLYRGQVAGQKAAMQEQIAHLMEHEGGADMLASMLGGNAPKAADTAEATEFFGQFL